MSETITAETAFTATEHAGPTLALAADCLACAWCGAAVPGTTPATVRELPGQVMPSRGYVSGLAVALAMCDHCHALDDHARALVDAHPAMVDVFGPGGAYPRAVGVVVAHELAGRAQPAADIEEHTWGQLVRLLGATQLALWSVQLTHDRASQCAAHPWSGVPAPALATFRAAWASLLAERHAEHQPPVMVSPPRITAEHLGRAPYPNPVAVTAGCSWCGRATEEVSAVDAVRLGGRDALERHCWVAVTHGRMAGHLCRACEAAHQLDGATGPSAVELAVLRFAGLGNRVPGALGLEGIDPWGALVVDAHGHPGTPEPAPNPEPWQHLGSADELRSQLAAAVGIMTVEVR